MPKLGKCTFLEQKETYVNALKRKFLKNTSQFSDFNVHFWNIELWNWRDKSSSSFGSIDSFMVPSIMRAWDNSPTKDIEVTCPESRNDKTGLDAEWMESQQRKAGLIET